MYLPVPKNSVAPLGTFRKKGQKRGFIYGREPEAVFEKSAKQTPNRVGYESNFWTEKTLALNLVTNRF